MLDLVIYAIIWYVIYVIFVKRPNRRYFGDDDKDDNIDEQ